MFLVYYSPSVGYYMQTMFTEQAQLSQFGSLISGWLGYGYCEGNSQEAGPPASGIGC